MGRLASALRALDTIEDATGTLRMAFSRNT